MDWPEDGVLQLALGPNPDIHLRTMIVGTLVAFAFLLAGLFAFVYLVKG